MLRFVAAFIVVPVALFAGPAVAVSSPMDGRAARVLAIVKDVQGNDKKRLLSEHELTTVLAASKSDNDSVRMAAAYALAFTRSESGKEALRTLESDRDLEVAGVAEFSRLRMHVVGLQRQELLSLLSFRLGDSQRPWVRTLLVNWLGDEYQEVAVPLFLAVLEREKNALVRAEVFFQVAIHGNIAQVKNIDSLLLKEPPTTASAFDEYTVFFLGEVSRNRTSRGYGLPSEFFLRDVIESRMKVMKSSTNE